jgi:AcrR family transcriptional regulator
MIGTVAQRRQEKVARIVTAAWALAREQGLGGVSLHALARAVGMRQPSLYTYFDSKNSLFDAMFADGNRQLLDRLCGLDLPSDPRLALKAFMAAFIDFALEDPARCALLLQRSIPGFEPSAEAYRHAEEVMEQVLGVLRAAGLDDQGDVDCFVAMVAGLIEAQLANDPGGDRWVRHLDRLTDLYLDDAERKNHSQ